jgi:hypothetical protein
MPLTRISLRRGKPAAYRTAVAESIYQAMRDTFEVPEDDKFMIVTEHDGGDFIYGAAYMDIARSDDLIIIQITVSNTRSLEQRRCSSSASPSAWRKAPASAPRTCSSISWRWPGRTGRSATGWRSRRDAGRSSYSRFPTSANTAPCGSVPCTIHCPPGTSIGPFMILPPEVLMRSAAASMPATLK